MIRRKIRRKITRRTLWFYLKLILRKIHKNKSFEQIVDELEQEINIVQPLYDFVKDHIDMSEDELVISYLNSIGA